MLWAANRRFLFPMLLREDMLGNVSNSNHSIMGPGRQGTDAMPIQNVGTNSEPWKGWDWVDNKGPFRLLGSGAVACVTSGNCRVAVLAYICLAQHVRSQGLLLLLFVCLFVVCLCF